MKWIGLHVEGFGKLGDFRCSFDAPVTVIYGPNEAGKSTMLAFIRSMLYGFATRKNPAERLEPTAGGRHGGRLQFQDSSGQSYILERFAKTIGGKLSVRPFGNPSAGSDIERIYPGNSAGSELPELSQGMWEQMFLGGVNERIYRQLFAVTLTELQAIGMLEGDELGKQLYHAGWGGGSAIASTEKLLSGQLDGLFRPRGSNQQINRLLKELDAAETQLRRLEDGINSYNEMADGLAASERQLQELEQRLPALRSQAALLNRALKNRSLWIARTALVRELGELAATKVLPSDIRRRWELWTVEYDRSSAGLRSVRQQADEIGRELDGLTYDEHLIEAVDEIETLLLSVERMSALGVERREAEAELREHSEALARLLTRISPDWTEQHLGRFRIAVADRERVREARAAMSEAAKASNHSEAELRSTREQIREVQAQLAEIDDAAGAGSSRLSEAMSGTGSGGLLDAETGAVGVDSRNREAAAEPFAGTGGLYLLPATPEALRHAARTFEDAWRELELSQLRAGQAQQGDSGAGAAGRSGSAALWSAALALAAAAALLFAAGWPTAAAAAGAAALAVAAFALLRQREARQAAAARAGRGLPRPAAGHAPSAAAAQLAAAEQALAAALRGLVSEPEAVLSALLAGGEAPSARGGAAHTPAPAAGADKPHAASRAYRQEAAAGIADSGSGEADRLQHTHAHAASLTLLEQLRTAIDARLDRLRASQHSAQRRGELQRRLSRLAALEAEQRQQSVNAAGHARTLEGEWQEWLASQTLPITLSPEAAMEIFDLAEQAALRQQARSRIIQKTIGMEAQLSEFEAAVKSLGTRFPAVSRGFGAADSGLSLRLLHSEAARHKAASARELEVKAELARLRQQEHELQETLNRLSDERRDWFSAVSVDNEPDFVEAVSRSERRREIEPELYRLEAELDAGLSPDEKKQLELWYKSVDGARLEEMAQETQTAAAEGEKRRNELMETIGRQRQTMEQLERGSDRAKLVAQREETAAILVQLVDRYAVAAAGLTLVRRTKRLMEEQRQPAVLKEASRYMARMSKGRYKRILVPEGEQTIRLETPDGQIVDSIYLSRGTAEQLYLSMRFALADEAAAAVEMPMILDDLFVNFDGSRLEAAIDLVGELAGRRQIILLTCHDHIRDRIMERLEHARLVQLSS
ncbi:AAA family ATPase [Paenibacillus nasutitermitis]|uniref:Rad50/SbcC-type AAA domain-containing protein n=1 Tax=Paenibacillus nasutitermitis TaxID=1652958 RepID=A0A916YPS8_9BACL|nr:AAA family ATPase [Paenibacillus nasutitermitis]GGD55999.1 hypothetical protein GCM10010911_12120 [Paenibacillus nasutitermitis]